MSLGYAECEDWTDTYHEHGELHYEDCDNRMLPERPLIRGFTWKIAFYRGALLRIQNRLYERRKPNSSSQRLRSPLRPRA